MNLPLPLQLAVSAAMAEITRQVGADPSLVVSDPDEDGRVQVEGTLDLGLILAAVLNTAQHQPAGDSAGA